MLKGHLKAVVVGVSTLSTTLATVSIDGTVTLQEGITVLLAVIAAVSATYLEKPQKSNSADTPNA